MGNLRGRQGVGIVVLGDAKSARDGSLSRDLRILDGLWVMLRLWAVRELLIRRFT